jgi:predicted membrane protein
MSECSKYQLLLQTDYVRLREKYDYLYLRFDNQIYQLVSNIYIKTFIYTILLLVFPRKVNKENITD